MIENMHLWDTANTELFTVNKVTSFPHLYTIKSIKLLNTQKNPGHSNKNNQQPVLVISSTLNVAA